MRIGGAFFTVGSLGFTGARPTASSAQYPQGGVGTLWRPHSLANPTPDIEYSAASREIGFSHTCSYNFVSSIQSCVYGLLRPRLACHHTARTVQ